MFGLDMVMIIAFALGIFVGLVIGNKNFRGSVLRALDGLMKSGKSQQANTKGKCPKCGK